MVISCVTTPVNKTLKVMATNVPSTMPHMRWLGGSLRQASAMTTALSPESRMSIQMICTTASQKPGSSMVIAAALPPRAFDRTLIPANSCLTFCRQKRHGQDTYRSFGPGLKEALATLSRAMPCSCPCFRQGQPTMLAAARAHESGEIFAQLTMGGIDEL